MNPIQQNSRRSAIVTSILGGVVVAAIVYGATTTFAGPQRARLGTMEMEQFLEREPELAGGLRAATAGLAREIKACFDDSKLGRFPHKEEYFLLLSFQAQGGVARVTDVSPAPAFPKGMLESEKACVAEKMKRLSFPTSRPLTFSVRFPMCVREAN
jgi:hypothetical protein